MPKPPMSPEEIEIIRGRILDTALDIIIEHGFANLSVRKIASRLGITATTIYNYYTNKDELNLMIRTRGFEKLYDLLNQRAGAINGLEGKIAALIRGYVEFGRMFPNYYDIMFTMNTPKYLDYQGTPIEPMAHREKQNAVKCLYLFVGPLDAFLGTDGEGKDTFIMDQVATFWADLHGMITLSNSRLFHEVLESVDDFIDRRTETLIERISFLKQRIESGEKLY